MNWTDNAIIISLHQFGESSAIVKAFTKQYGLHAGMVKNIKSPKNRSIYMIGNIVDLSWQARLSEHLGNYTGELKESIAALVMSDKIALCGLTSICTLLAAIAVERTEDEELFVAIYHFLKLLKTEEIWYSEYLHLEILLLSRLGFGLDLEKCAVTGSAENLIYVSPRTGRAVSKDAAKGYEEKLFRLPSFLINSYATSPKISDILDSLKITGYFLTKHVPNTTNMSTRERLVEILKRSANNEIVNL